MEVQLTGESPEDSPHRMLRFIAPWAGFVFGLMERTLPKSERVTAVRP